MAFSGTRGYSSYRGRGNKGKIFLAVLLILVILAAVGFIIAREHMSYDADGNLRFTLPWQKETEQPQEPVPSGDVVIREPEQTAAQETVHGLLLSADPRTAQTWEEEQAAAGDDVTMLAMTLKDDTGHVFYDSSAAVTGAVSENAARDTAREALMGRADLAKAARISCFHDPLAANADVEGMGLKNTGGYIFYDGNNSQWLDPGLAKARNYLLDLIREATAQGYGEIILTDISYPTVGKLDKIDFTHAELAQDTSEEGRCYWIESFLREVRNALPEGTVVSLELPADTIRSGYDGDAGQNLSELAPLVDRIYAQTTAAEAPALEAAVKVASDACGFVPEVKTKPAALENWLLIS